jgi:hypothetical protein
MRVDPSRRDHQTSGIDLALTGSGLAANLGYAIAVQSEVAGEAWSASTVYDGAAANDRAVHLVLLILAALSRGSWTRLVGLIVSR